MSVNGPVVATSVKAVPGRRYVSFIANDLNAPGTGAQVWLRYIDSAQGADEKLGFARPKIASSISIPAGPQPDQKQTRGFYRNGFKRVLDIALILATLPIVLPVVLILAAFVALNGGQPFYSQPRVGMNGRVYRIWKLRTMVRDADARLDSYLRENPVLRHEWLTKQKLLNDPRITPLGRILRKSSLDELPQLFNVLIGDMSLVGPRPMMVSQEEMYPGRAYYRLRPGITGPWQVSDRNESRFAERARFDDEYDRSLSLKGDVALLAATFRVVLRGTGH